MIHRSADLLIQFIDLLIQFSDLQIRFADLLIQFAVLLIQFADLLMQFADLLNSQPIGQYKPPIFRQLLCAAGHTKRETRRSPSLRACISDCRSIVAYPFSRFYCLFLPLPVFCCFLLSLPASSCFLLSLAVTRCLFLSLLTAYCLFLSLPVSPLNRRLAGNIGRNKRVSGFIFAGCHYIHSSTGSLIDKVLWLM